jgi:DNA-nicking Smr family endonuclease
MPRRERTPSRAETEMWRAAIKDVVPLPGRRRFASDPTSTPGPAAPGIDAPRVRRPSDRARDAGSGLDRRTAEKLRRGQLPLEGRLDLHGMTQDEAHRSLAAFLARAQLDGRRCVLVITGKGFRRLLAEGEAGVLKTTVPRWLGEAPNRSRVLATAPAQQKDGGSGALYVLLRRRRVRED